MDSNNFITHLENLSVIELSGEQKAEYLHGQITIDTKNFNDNKARLAAHCDFKGKTFSVSFVSKFKESFLLTAHKESAEASLQQLKKYGVFSKVDIDLCANLKTFGVRGDKALEQLKILFPDVVNEHLSCVQNSFGQVISFNDTSKRYLFLATEKGEQRLQDITQEAFSNTELYWEQLEIEAGLANIQAASMSEYVPQMLNLQCLNAIDFDKGCYMGQEVVARTKFLGKNKRATFLFSGDAQIQEASTIEPAVGDTIEVAIDGNWRRGGTVLRLVRITTEQSTQLIGLAIMANDTKVGTVIRLKDSQLELSIQPLPYPID